MNIEPRIGEVFTTDEIIELRRRWNIPYMEMISYLDMFRENLEKCKEEFPKNKNMDVEKEYEKEKQRLFKKGNKKIFGMGKQIDEYQWKLIKK